MSPLEQYSEELSDLVINWYIVKVREDYHLKDIYNQLLRSTTSIGANIAESKFAQSDADYKSKMNIALKEASESRYWIYRFIKINAIDDELKNELCKRLDNIIRMLAKLCKDK